MKRKRIVMVLMIIMVCLTGCRNRNEIYNHDYPVYDAR